LLIRWAGKPAGVRDPRHPPFHSPRRGVHPPFQRQEGGARADPLNHLPVTFLGLRAGAF